MRAPHEVLAASSAPCTPLASPAHCSRSRSDRSARLRSATKDVAVARREDLLALRVAPRIDPRAHRPLELVGSGDADRRRSHLCRELGAAARVAFGSVRAVDARHEVDDALVDAGSVLRDGPPNGTLRAAATRRAESLSRSGTGRPLGRYIDDGRYIHEGGCAHGSCSPPRRAPAPRFFPCHPSPFEPSPSPAFPS